MRLSRKPFKDQSGQAIIEYVLLLIVVLSLLLGLAFKFNSAFRSYVSSYFGEYTACLLETGELPAIGGVTASNICTEQFARFDPNSGAPGPGGRAPNFGGGGNGGGGGGGSTGPGGGGGGGGRGGGGGSLGPGGGSGGQIGRGGRGNLGGGGQGGSGGPGSAQNPSTTRPKADGGAGSSAASGGGGPGSSSASGFLNQRSRSGPERVVVGTVSQGSDDVSYTGSTERLSVRNVRFGDVKSGSANQQIIKIDRGIAANDPARKKANKAIKAKVEKSLQQNERMRPKKQTLQLSELRPSAPPKEITAPEFSFGRILKFAIVIAIVALLLILIGGQVAQISKSWEKE